MATGRCERLTDRAFMPSWVRREHEARYAFCAPYVPRKVVVDCACGEGFGAVAFAGAGAAVVYAFDRDARAVAVTQARAGARRILCGVGDAARLPLPDRIADVYVALETLEHLDDDRAFLREAARVLKPDGLFICSTPNRAVTNPGTALRERPGNPFHVREYAGEQLKTLLGGFFRRVEWYGQHGVSEGTVRLLARLRPLISRRGAALASRIHMMPRWWSRRPATHAVQPMRPGAQYEYVIAVCRQPVR
ncbi:MAG: methyltransferase domain-containing protein [Candidatus Omnitrophica bacterium]|nr:methyltransferase domain-containing protein [Candidatus Omnitrophota bacterium]